jgi:hypothetical protein
MEEGRLNKKMNSVEHCLFVEKTLSGLKTLELRRLPSGFPTRNILHRFRGGTAGERRCSGFVEHHSQRGLKAPQKTSAARVLLFVWRPETKTQLSS